MNLNSLVEMAAEAVGESEIVGHLKEIIRPLIEEVVDERLLEEKSKNYALVSVRDNDSLSEAISKELRKPLVEVERVAFGDGEKKIIVRENLRGKHIYLIATMGPGEDPDISLMNTLRFITTLNRTCKVRTISVVGPCLWYQAQDKAHARREPIMVRDVADYLTGRGMDHIMVCCLHSEQIEALFDSFDHLKTEPIFAHYLDTRFYEDRMDKLVLLSPDEGGVRQREELILNLSPEVFGGSASVLQIRSREDVDTKKVLELIGDVAGKTVVILDDMIRSGSTMFNAAAAAKASGATKVLGVITHFFGSGSSKGTFGQSLMDSALDELIVTNTRGEALARVQDGTLLRKCMTVLDISPYLSKAIQHYHLGATVKEMIATEPLSNLYKVAHQAEGKE